ncbi:MAG: DUF2752 domain-containing protein [Verrucomicrobiota bacterium]
MNSRRAAVVALLAAICCLLAWQLYRNDPASSWLPGCLLNRVTGLHCAGCGMTRATCAALHGDFPAAFRLNPLMMIVAPLFCAWLAVQAGYWMFGKTPPSPPTGWKLGLWAVGLVIAFTIVRNIPMWPFELLAPH